MPDHRPRSRTIRWRRAAALLAMVPLVAVTLPNRAGSAEEAGLDPGRRQALTNLLVQDCGSCHGLTMAGGLGSPLTPEALAVFSDTDLLRTILEGRPGTAMPPWAPLLTPEEAAWMVRQLRAGVRP